MNSVNFDWVIECKENIKTSNFTWRCKGHNEIVLWAMLEALDRLKAYYA